MFEFVMLMSLIGCGGVMIGEAVFDFKKGRHYFFGLDVMIAITSIIIFAILMAEIV